MTFALPVVQRGMIPGLLRSTLKVRRMSKINRVEAVMNGLEQLAAVPSRRATQRSPALARSTVFFIADATAAVIAWSGSATLLHAASLADLAGPFDPTGSAAALWLGSAACVVLWLAFRRHHDLRLSWSTQISDVLAGSTVALASTAIVGAVLMLLGSGAAHQMQDVEIIPRTWLALWLTGWMTFTPALMVTRGIGRFALRSSGFWSLRTVIVAPRATAETVAAALRSNHRLGFDVVGNLDPADPRQAALLRNIDASQTDLLIVAADLNRPNSLEQTLADLQFTGLPIATTLVHPGLAGLDTRHRAFSGHDVVLLNSPPKSLVPIGGWRKQCIDKCGALILLIALSPLFLLLTVLIRRDGGHALFRHQRLGAGGRMFACMKFRSMVANSDRVLEELLANNPLAVVEWQATQKLRRDPRITTVGRFLRKSSLDELPQLFNVLRGEMSLVGPRPIVRAEIARYGNEISYYYKARPGLTGLWQVSGRSDTSYAQRVQLDVRYVCSWTLWRDIVIVLKTIPAVLLRKGAV